MTSHSWVEEGNLLVEGWELTALLYPPGKTEGKTFLGYSYCRHAAIWERRDRGYPSANAPSGVHTVPAQNSTRLHLAKSYRSMWLLMPFGEVEAGARVVLLRSDRRAGARS